MPTESRLMPPTWRTTWFVKLENVRKGCVLLFSTENSTFTSGDQHNAPAKCFHSSGNRQFFHGISWCVIWDAPAFPVRQWQKSTRGIPATQEAEGSRVTVLASATSLGNLSSVILTASEEKRKTPSSVETDECPKKRGTVKYKHWNWKQRT